MPTIEEKMDMTFEQEMAAQLELSARLAQQLFVLRHNDQVGGDAAYSIIKGCPYVIHVPSLPQARPPQAPAEEADSTKEAAAPNTLYMGCETGKLYARDEKGNYQEIE